MSSQSIIKQLVDSCVTVKASMYDIVCLRISKPLNIAHLGNSQRRLISELATFTQCLLVA